MDDIARFNEALAVRDREICDLLAGEIERELPTAEGKIWHGHPVWFLDGNPTVGYSKQKRGVRLMFWSGASFDEPQLGEIGSTFKDASIFYRSVSDVVCEDLSRWLRNSRLIAWDYKNVIKRKGRLLSLK